MRGALVSGAVLAGGTCLALWLRWRWRAGTSGDWMLCEEPAGDSTILYSVRRGKEVHHFPGKQRPDLPTVAPGTPTDTAHEAWLVQHVRYRPTDVVIATFPKCGTTYVEQIVLLLLNGGRTERLDPLSKNSGAAHDGGVGKVWPEACLVPRGGDPSQYPPGRPPRPEMRPMLLSTFDALPAPRVLKTHAPVTKLLSRDTDGTPAPARYIVVTRNPLDACVSCYYHAWHPQSQGWPFDARTPRSHRTHRTERVTPPRFHRPSNDGPALHVHTTQMHSDGSMVAPTAPSGRPARGQTFIEDGVTWHIAFRRTLRAPAMRLLGPPPNLVPDRRCCGCTLSPC